MPIVFATSVIGVIFNFIFSHQFGPVNLLLQKLGLSSIMWFSSRPTALATTIIASVWQNFGLNMIFFIVGLSGISGSLYESASLDGAGFWAQLFQITFPNMKKVFFIVLLNSMLGSLRETELFLTLTNGSPAGRSEVMMTYVYKKFFEDSTTAQDLGYVSALSVLGSVMLAIFAILTLKERKMNRKHKILIYSFLLFMAAVTLMPMAFAISGFFKTSLELSTGGISLIPDTPTFNNYRRILGEGNFLRYALNTFEVALVNCALSAIFVSMAAYSFKRGNYAGKKVLLGLVLAPLIFCSGTLNYFPLIKIATKIGLCNKIGLGTILFIQDLPFLLFLNIGFLNSIDKELDYAARIDGCSFLGTWWRVILPVSKPMTTTIVLISFCNSMKNFLLQNCF